MSSSAVIIMKKRNQWNTYIVIKKTDKVLPAHMVFENSELLSNELDNAALLQGEVMDEFDKLEEYVKQKIEPEESAEVASQNLIRNRYKDILPYDSNVVTLSTPTGKLISKMFNK